MKTRDTGMLQVSIGMRDISRKYKKDKMSERIQFLERDCLGEREKTICDSGWYALYTAVILRV